MKVSAKSVCAFPFRIKGGKVEYLMLRRVPKKGGFWQGVTGTIEKGESAARTALRETIEETGLKPIQTLVVDYVHSYFVADRDRICLEPCFGMRVAPGEVTLSREHDDFVWTSCEEALKLLRWPGNKAALKALNDALSKEKLDA